MKFILRFINEEYVGLLDPRDQYRLAATESETWRAFVLRRYEERLVVEILGNGRRRLVQRLTLRLHDHNQDAKSLADLAVLMKILAQELLCLMPSHKMFRPADVSGIYGGPASASARSVTVGDVPEPGSWELLTVHRDAEHGSMEQSVECTWQRGESESIVGAWRDLPRRKRRPMPRTPVRKGALRLPRRRPGLALPGVARSPAQGKTTVLGKLRRRAPHQACGEETQETGARTCQTKYQLWTAARVRFCLLRSTLWRSQLESWKKVFWAPFQEESKPSLEEEAQRVSL